MKGFFYVNFILSLTRKKRLKKITNRDRENWKKQKIFYICDIRQWQWMGEGHMNCMREINGESDITELEIKLYNKRSKKNHMK